MSFGDKEGRDKQWLQTYCRRKQDMGTSVGKKGETGPMSMMRFSRIVLDDLFQKHE